MKKLNFYDSYLDGDSLYNEDRIQRIQYMESIFDQLQEMARDDPHKIEEDTQQERKLKILIDYYEGGQWLRDYESDERGELPAQLKRGVLSEDGVYNLIMELNS